MTVLGLDENNFYDEVSQGIVLVDFYADWCGPCRRMHPVLQSVSSEVTDAVIAKVNIDESPNLTSTFKIEGVPSFILFKDGEIVERYVGAIPKQDIFGILEKARGA